MRRPRDLDAADGFSELCRIVVRDTYGLQSDFIRREHLLDEGESRASAADDHHPFFLRMSARQIIFHHDDDAFGKTYHDGDIKEQRAVNERRADIDIRLLRQDRENQIQRRRTDDGKTEFKRVDDPHGREHDRVHSEESEQSDRTDDIAERPSEKPRAESPVLHRNEIREQNRNDDRQHICEYQKNFMPNRRIFTFHS